MPLQLQLLPLPLQLLPLPLPLLLLSTWTIKEQTTTTLSRGQRTARQMSYILSGAMYCSYKVYTYMLYICVYMYIICIYMFYLSPLSGRSELYFISWTNNFDSLYLFSPLVFPPLSLSLFHSLHQSVSIFSQVHSNPTIIYSIYRVNYCQQLNRTYSFVYIVERAASVSRSPSLSLPSSSLSFSCSSPSHCIRKRLISSTKF